MNIQVLDKIPAPKRPRKRPRKPVIKEPNKGKPKISKYMLNFIKVYSLKLIDENFGLKGIESKIFTS